MSEYTKEVVNDLYQAALVTVGAVTVSMASKKLTGQSLATPASLKETVKLAVAVAASTLLVKKAQKQGYIPKELKL